MSKKVYLDCGGHFGEGLEKYISMYGMNSEWTIFSFEPNTSSFDKLIKNKEIVLDVFFENKAVWIEDGTIPFHAEFPPETDISDGAGSSIMDLKFWKPKSDSNPGAGDVFDTYDVECIDISKFILENFEPDDTIVLKFDIEGAEFDILRKMIDDGSISYVNDLYIEFHDFCYLKETVETRQEIIDKIQSLCGDSITIRQN